MESTRRSLPITKTSLSIALALGTVLGVSTLTGCNNNEQANNFEQPIPDVVDFNYDVKPILSDTCYLCHGPDKENARGGLSLSNFQDATSHITDNGLNALIPGNAEDSEAFMRILSEDEDYMMPPRSSNLTLSKRDKAIIKKWIDQGAEYKKHWALITPERAETPTSNMNWQTNDIDAFIEQKILDNGLTPNEQADKASLIRRVAFDLTGLPPSDDLLANFMADNSDNAYEKAVDALMASPAYGERMATEWLDVARYADTHGYSTDFYRDMSPYRDWVIKAFNNNQAFDEFVTWQVAGDLLPNATQEQKLATAFNRVHAQNGEGGIVSEEFRIEYVKDRVQTIGTGLLGLTMHCAQCHDHKYDPISAKDYYSVTAFFNSIDDSGQISYDPKDMPVPTLMLPNEQQEKEIAALDEAITAQQVLLNKEFGTNNNAFKQWLAKATTTSQVKEDSIALIAHYPLSKADSNETVASALDKSANGKVIYGSDPKKKEGEPMVHIAENGREAIKLNGDDPLYFPSIKGFENAKPFTVSIDAKIPSDIEEGVLFHYNKAGILYNFKGFDVGIEDNKWLVRIAHTYPYNAIVLKSKNKVTRNQWQSVSMSYDGSSSAEGVKLYLDGKPVEMNVERDNLYKELKHNAEGVLKEIGLKIGARWRSRGVPDTLVDNLKVYSRALTSVEILGEKSSASEEQLLALYNQRFNDSYQKENDKLLALRQQRNSLAESIKEVMVMEELPEPRQAYILKRGSYAMRGEPVSPGVPETILPYNESWPKDRTGLAKWLTDKDQPLVPRVVINRYWQMIFGNGLVRTPEDFGNQGNLPSHPALLDWLAREFVDSGWDVKHMVKLMVMSSTYRQSSKASPTLTEKDPENVLLARGPTSRLTAEMIRDLALTASGLLETQIGGESVHPYQPDGIWRMNNMDYKQGSGKDLYRRSMYTIYKRSVPPPNMTAFDSPTRSYSVGVRQQTNTPLQSLALLNDPQIVEASRVLASNVLAETNDQAQQLTKVYQKLTSRTPNKQELAVVQQMYQDMIASFEQAPKNAKAFVEIGETPLSKDADTIKVAALGSVANMLINHDASVIKR